jgi:two-component system OmpR family response regulator
LEQCGYDVPVARTCADALKLAEAEGFDLYLLDHRLPDGSGIELCREIRAFDSRTPILFCSAAAREADRQAALAAGAQGYLIKPISLEELDSAVALMLDEEKCLSEA